MLAIALAAGMLLPAASSSAEPALTDAHGNVDPSVATADTPASRLYNARCGSCHEHPQGRIPPRSSLRYSPPENVRHALVDGAMKPMTAGLSDADILSLVVFLTGSKPDVAADPMANRCATPADEVVLSPGDWTSTHGDDSNSRFRGNTGVDAGCNLLAAAEMELRLSRARRGAGNAGGKSGISCLEQPRGVTGCGQRLHALGPSGGRSPRALRQPGDVAGTWCAGAGSARVRRRQQHRYGSRCGHRRRALAHASRGARAVAHNRRSEHP